MATELTWRAALEGEDARAALSIAARIVEAEPTWTGSWTADEGQPTGARPPVAGGAPASASARTGVVLWRLLGDHEVQEPVELDLRATATAGEVVVRATLADAGPMCAITDAAGAPADHPYHERVLANLGLWTRIGFELIEALGAERAACFTGGGEPYLWDAHVAFWRSERVAALDIGSVRDRGPDVPGADRLHAWRTADQQRELIEAFAAARSAPTPSVERIRELLAGGQFDFYRLGTGFAVLEHPWYLNAFVDRFVLGALLTDR